MNTVDRDSHQRKRFKELLILVDTCQASTLFFQNRCVNMIAHLFHAKIGEDGNVVGVRTVGLSEVMMLAGLAFEKWQNKHKAKRLEASNLSLVLHLGLRKPCLDCPLSWKFMILF
ncbi:glutamate decarboxylase 5-like isoform X2 [Vigna angularis]|uniref:glutamate decarboxylase 5-like isoform X2 n=1 Tax=Phaseolus angularis TaxID=3914 RepID=UPI0022B2D223|nr:glutamate decarboxylase 5-like isoform X2 [Vigna angularis]XP_052733352.1 glutamate decarboxylase 5-like isoform X2 [Vigna angularis]